MSHSSFFTPAIRRAAYTPVTPFTHNAHSVTLGRRWVAVFLLGFNRRTTSTSSRDTVMSAVLLVLKLRRVICRQARYWARTPFGEFCVGTRSWTIAIVARDLFKVPLTTTITKV